MKQELSQKTLATILGALAVVLAIIVYFVFFKGASGTTAEELGIGPPAKPGGGVEGAPVGGNPYGPGK